MRGYDRNIAGLSPLLENERDQLIRKLFEQGYVVLRLSSEEEIIFGKLRKKVTDFFSLPKVIKETEVYEGYHFGYREAGVEYSATPERPDLNVSLTFSVNSPKNIKLTSPAQHFYNVANVYTKFLDKIIDQLLGELKSKYKSKERIPETREGSWFQVNYYKPQEEDRVKLQDRHEDGHLVTFWNSEQPGMQIFDSKGKSIPVVLGNNEILIMPGSLLYQLTGGDIKPVYHQVIRENSIKERISYMYFVNPSLGSPLYTYNSKTNMKQVDIVALGTENPTAYGLPILRKQA